jgi:hypothetical protein
LGIIHIDDFKAREAGIKRIPRWSNLDHVKAGTLVWQNRDGTPFVTDREFIAIFPSRIIPVEQADPEDYYMGHWRVMPTYLDAPPVVKTPT